MSEAYKQAGVDIHAGYRSVELIKDSVKKTFTQGVLTDIGGFGGLFELAKAGDYKNPVLVSGTDGVGTKLKIAFLTDQHDTVGQDCVAMCVNDVICSGAKPLFFLDYLAVGKNVPERVAEIVRGVSDGCMLSECALIGGETAEMPGFYPCDEYDLAGFSVGVVDKDRIIDGTTVAPGDVLIGVASSGIHSNGYSLVRSVFALNGPQEEAKAKLGVYYDELGMTLGEALIIPTKIYVKTVFAVLSQYPLKAISHITGGGFYENIPRMLPNGMKAVIQKSAFPVLPIFQLLQKTGGISEEDMFHTYNMGIGLCMAVNPGDAEGVIKIIASLGEKAYRLGTVERGDAGVRLLP